MKWACHGGFNKWHLIESEISKFTFCGADIDKEDGDVIVNCPPQNEGKR